MGRSTTSRHLSYARPSDDGVTVWWLNVAKRAGRVGFRSGKSGLRVNWVAGENGSFLNESIKLRVKSG